MPKILVVEDDSGLLRMVRDWLVCEHHIVETADNGKSGLSMLVSGQYDVIVLDWELPEMSGIEIIHEYRKQGGVAPILLLTGKDSISEKESGLDSGADDYLTKPFHMKELSARLRALVRRNFLATSGVLRIKALELNPVSFTVTKGEQKIQLLPKEFALLEFMMRHPNQVFSAESLLDRVWSSESDASVDAITTCIKRIRKKIDTEGDSSIIRTVHGVGYKIESE